MVGSHAPFRLITYDGEQTVRALSTTYYSAYVRQLIAEAQHTIDTHVTSAWTGCCQSCGRPGPCDERREAEQVLARYRRLPRRRPGATLHRQHQVESFDWFSD